MKSLQDYINESKEPFPLTLEWLKKMYKEYNEKLFNNELTDKVELIVGDSRELSKLINGAQHTLGFTGYHKDNIQALTQRTGFRDEYVMENGMYVMAYNWKRVTDINILGPYIAMNTDFDHLNQLHHEDTLIHEMIHMWVEKDGLWPKQAHGKEFKAKCKEVKALAKKIYDKTYWLDTYADLDSTNPGQTAEKKEEDKIFRLKCRMRLLYIIMKDGEKRMIWCTGETYRKIYRDMIKAEGEDNVKLVVKLNSLYEIAYNDYGHFKASRKYTGYLPVSKYPKLEKFIDEKIKEKHDWYIGEVMKGSINEGKKEYIKPDMEVIEMPKGINISTFNLEDFIKSLDKDVDVTPNEQNEKNFIEIK